jgi:hypothetical protein
VSGKHKVKYTTQAKRRRGQALLRLGVWIFIFVFALSVVGGLIGFVFVH